MQEPVQSSPDDSRRSNDKATDPGHISVRPTPAAIQLTRFTGPDDAVLTKQFSLAGNGTITKQNQPYFSSGSAKTVKIKHISEIEMVINRLGTNQCITTGIFDSSKCSIVRDGDLTPELHDQGVRSRTMKYMSQPDVGVALLDHDIGPYMPDHLRCDSPDALMSMLREALPKLATVAYSGAGSCSNGISVTATGKSYEGGGGLHVYITVIGVDLEVLRLYVLVNLWTNGMGYIAFARNGAMLERCIVDGSVLSQERLIYEAAPILGEGLSRHPREWQHRDGTPLSGDLSLTDDQVAEYERLVASEKALPENKAKAEELAAIYHEGRVAVLAEHKSICREEAEKLIPKQTPAERDGRECLLDDNDIIEIQGQPLSVTELLQRGSEFDKVAMPDPVEGKDYGLTTAKFFYNDGISPCIHSFAHGLKTIYRLKGHEGKQIPDKPVETAGGLDPLALIQRQFALINLNGRLWVLDGACLNAKPDQPAGKLALSNRSDGSLLILRAVTAQFPNENAKETVKDFFTSPDTVCSRGVEFNPAGTTEGYLNLWLGPTATPQAGDWQPIRDFLRVIICNGDDEACDYLIRFLAHALQQPADKPGVVIVMLGGQGCGKGSFGRILRKIWGATYLQVHNMDAVTGNFNGSLERVFIVFMDEALFVGDRRSTDALKSLVTEPVIHINEKHQPARQIRSYHRYVVATNADHWKHTEKDDRRDFVLRISEERKGDHAYWRELHYAIEDGTVEAMMHDLLVMDLSGFNVRDKPETRELLVQKLQSLDPIPRWWYDCLQSGSISDDGEWPEFIGTTEAIEGIVEFSGHKLYKKPAAIDLIRAMHKLCPSAHKKQRKTNFGRQRGLALPTLERSREEFELYIGGAIEW